VEGQKLEWFPRRRNLNTALSTARPSPQQHRLRLKHRQISMEGEMPGHSRWKNPVSGGPFIICWRNAPGQVYRSLSLPLIKLCLRDFNPPPHLRSTQFRNACVTHSAWQENPENNLFSSIHATTQLHISTFWYAPAAGEMTTLRYVQAPQINNNPLNCWNCSRKNQMWN
jgi:hypothetical protein